MDDAAVIRASLEDPAAFGDIFDRHYTAVLTYCSRRTGQAAGEEVAAQTFLVAFEIRGRFDLQATSARPWLLGIATNLIRRHFRDEKTHLNALRRLPVDRSWHEDAHADRLDTLRHGQMLLNALHGFDPSDRDAFLLLALADLSYDEIASALQIPVGTVRSKIHRVRTRLRERFPSDTAIQWRETDEAADEADG